MNKNLQINRKPSFNIYQYPVPKSVKQEQKDHIEWMLDLEGFTDDFTIFVSIPYCSNQCNSCSFYKNYINLIDSSKILERYIEVVAKQAELYSKTPKFKNATCMAMYFGGGTASLLSPKQLKKIITSIITLFRLHPDAEITLEANPSHLTLQYLTEIHSSEINRISIGLQSLNDKILRVINTLHNKKQSLLALKNVVRFQYFNFNVDLLYGVPTQSAEDLLYDLKRVIDFNPASISLNRYKIFTGSRLEHMIARGKFRPTEEAMKDEMLERSREILENAGYAEDSLSSFSKNASEKKYKRYTYQLGKESIGLGAGAYGYINGYLIKAGNNVKKYTQDIEDGRFVSCEFISKQATKRNRMQKYLMHNLLTGQVNIKIFESIFNENMIDCFGEILMALESKGLIQVSKNNIHVTNFGKSNIYNILSNFFEE